MKDIQASIYQNLDELYEEAKVYIEIWMRKVAERELSRKQHTINKESTNYNLALEFNDVSFRLRWFHYQFVKTGSKTIRVTKSVAIPESLKYSASQFKYAEPWELELINQVEDAAYIIRHKVQNLMKMHRLLITGSKFVKEPLTITPSKDRVTKSTQSIKKYKEQLR